MAEPQSRPRPEREKRFAASQDTFHISFIYRPRRPPSHDPACLQLSQTRTISYCGKHSTECPHLTPAFLCFSPVLYVISLPSRPCILTGNQVSYQCFHHLESRYNGPLIALLFVVPTLLSIPISYHVPWPAAAVLSGFLTYGSAVKFFTLMYRLSPFHPLAKYPGPALTKMSKFWVAYLCAQGDQHRYYKSLHDRYGDVVRVGLYQGSHSLHVCLVAQLTQQGRTSSQFEMPHLYTRYLGKEAFPRLLVRIRLLGPLHN